MPLFLSRHASARPSVRLKRVSAITRQFTVGALLLTPLVFLTQRLTAQAQALITDEDVADYARAVTAIEPPRQEAFAAASDILTSADSNLSLLDYPLSCTEAQLDAMPDISRADRVSLRTVLVEFCNQASDLAEENNLTPLRFNTITTAHRDDPDLTARIQAEIGSL